MARTSRFSTKHLFIGAATTALLSLSVVPPGGADEAPQTEAAKQGFDIPQQPLSEALAEFARQSKANVVAPSALTRGKVSAAVAGEMTPADALARLVVDAGLQIKQSDNGAFIVAQAVASGPKPERTQFAQAETDPPEVIATNERRERRDEDQVLRQEKVTVTGTLIRGLAPESSPLQIYDREDIAGSGVTTVEQFLRTLPQNFGGGSTEFAQRGLPNDADSRVNYSFGTGANLRGLGSGSTLVLLNGNRLAPTSTIGNYVDVSMIPLSAVERVDVLTDGASSIYGADAVAGVVNFVLRSDFEGAETSLRYGSVTKGDMEEYRFSQTVGDAWETGNAIAAYEFYDRDNLTLADRPEIAAPSLSNGTPITGTHLFDLLPRQTRNSGLVAINQDVGSSLSVSANALYSLRNVESTTGAGSSFFTISKSHTESEAITVSGSVDYAATDRWDVSLKGAYSEVNNKENLKSYSSATPSISNTRFNSEVASIDLILNGDVIELPGGMLKIALGGHVRSEDFIYQILGRDPSRAASRDVSSAYGEMAIPIIGASNSIPGVERLELNLSGRLDDYSDFGNEFTPKIGALWAPSAGLKFRASYGESYAPPPLGRVGDLNRSGTVYRWSYIRDLYGLDLQDPALADVNYLIVSGTAADLEPETSEAFTIGGDWEWNSDPYGWSASATYYDIAFEDRLGSTPIPQNQVSAVVPYLAWADSLAFPPGTVLFFPSEADVDQLLGTFSRPPTQHQGTPVENIGIINFASVIRNLASTKTRGIDADLRYEFESHLGVISAGVNANYILDFSQQAADTTPEVETLNALYNPVDLTLRGTLGLARGGFTANLFVNFTDSYAVDGTDDAARMDSWTTADLTMSYAFGADDASWLRGAKVSFSAQNLFDKAPPMAPALGSLRIAGYDPANASPLGRFVAIEISKSF